MTDYVRRFARIVQPRKRPGMRGLGQVPMNPQAINPVEVSAPSGVQDIERPVWIDPPRQWENVDQINYATLPAVGADVTILSFTVPIGRNGVINKIACNFVGGGWVEGSGDVVWRILVDGAPPPGATSYNSIIASAGSPANPVKISGFRVFENQLITLIARNVAIIPAGQLVGGRLMGYYYPREFEAENIWI